MHLITSPQVWQKCGKEGHLFCLNEKWPSILISISLFVVFLFELVPWVTVQTKCREELAKFCQCWFVLTTVNEHRTNVQNNVAGYTLKCIILWNQNSTFLNLRAKQNIEKVSLSHYINLNIYNQYHLSHVLVSTNKNLSTISNILLWPEHDPKMI